MPATLTLQCGIAAAQMKKTASEFAPNASTLGDSYRSAAEEAR